MQANRKVGSAPERWFATRLQTAGIEFAANPSLPVAGGTVRPDFSIDGLRIAVFIDGCFWHRCPLHGVEPASNSDYWAAKLKGNVERDGRVNLALQDAGWAVLRVWEHDLEAGAAAVMQVIAEHPGGGPEIHNDTIPSGQTQPRVPKRRPR